MNALTAQLARAPWLGRACGHLLACVAYPLLWALAYDIYVASHGVPRSTGYALGMTLHFLLNLFVVVNLALIFVANLKVRLLVTLLLSGLALAWLYPDHPLRGLLTAGLKAGVMLLAIAIDMAYRAACCPRKSP